MKGSFAPGPWTIALTIFLTLGALEYFSHPPAFELTFCMAPLLITFVLYDNVNRWVRYLDADSFHRQSLWTPSTGWRLAVFPACLFLVLSAAVYPWPMIYRFLLSRDAFERKVVEVQQTDLDQGPQRIGLYWIKRVENAGGGGVHFITGQVSLIRWGSIMSPRLRPAALGTLSETGMQSNGSMAE
jgi:hypothetical protein